MSVDKSDAVRNHFVYRYFDADGDLLYVGCSHRPEIRLREHRSTRPGMCAAIARIKVSGPYCYKTARGIERDAIRTEEPICGWTPAKQRDKVARSQWIDRRTAELVQRGISFRDALVAACDEAEATWPHPMHDLYDPPTYLAARAGVLA
ncbi:G-I-Y Y-I-G endonuclease [Gordonia phage Asapag]|uniref:G-I-Y Y-I-G endonuclease n=1 Tax=Gordonia phage Asapag TaxID=2507862 RepID=A0A410TDN9_9CAUD|nr:G-I-Y Y-I-G endonuclease [Gordonia phage Asapag]QAU07146.1 G-I-Y Y-I-G endonuclease [Gordonia phage Asapag]